jgi:glycosyltransferase involved in cell wall biosynthesis
MLSIITPVYNGKQFLEGCIQNVVDQFSVDIEHIIVDAGSTDGTVEMIDDYARKYSHIRWISEPDQGQSDAMNKGIGMARGEIISFLNVDDFYAPGTLQRIISLGQNFPSPTLLVGNCRILGEDDRLLLVNCPKKLDVFSLVSLKAPFPLNPSAYFYHKSLHQKIGPYPIDEHYLMDLDFILKAIPNSNVVYYDEIWGNHRQIEGTKTVEFIKSGEHFKAIKKLLVSHAKRVLPLHQQILVAMELEVVYRFKYFAMHPQAILASIRRKIDRRLLQVTG